MSSSREEVLRFGANQIRGYVGGDLTLSITPRSVLLPPVVVDHLDMPLTLKDADVSADTIVISNNDSTHAQTIAASGDLAITASTAGKDVRITAATDVNVTAPGQFNVTAPILHFSGVCDNLVIPQNSYGTTTDLNLRTGGYYAATVTATSGITTATTIRLWRMGTLVHLQLVGTTALTVGSAKTAFGTGTIPVGMQPAVAIRVPVYVKDDATPAIGYAVLFSDGKIDIFATAAGGSFAADRNCDFDDVMATYYSVPS